MYYYLLSIDDSCMQHLLKISTAVKNVEKSTILDRIAQQWQALTGVVTFNRYLLH